MFLFEVTDALEAAKIRYAIVGGYALAFHGIVRATMDIDLILSLNLQQFEKAEKALLSINLKSRLPIRAQDVIKMRKEYIENRNLTSWSFVNYQDPTRQVDILITDDVTNMTVQKITIKQRKIAVVSLEDLLQMKVKAGRPQDLIDINNIKKMLHEKKTE